MNHFCRLCALFILFSTVASAKTVWFGDEILRIELAYGKPTVFRFPSKVSAVQNAEKYEIAPLNSQSPNYAEVSIEPRTTTGGDAVNFLLSDSSVAKIRLIPVSGDRSERLVTFYELKKRESLEISRDEDGSLSVAGYGDQESNDKIKLMKALILGNKISGYQIRDVGKNLNTGLKGVEASLVRVYTGSDLNGYVFKIVNKASQSSYEIDIRRLKIGEPNLALMSQVDRKLIEPEKTGRYEAYLTIVALPSSLSRDVTLPVSWVKKEDERK